MIGTATLPTPSPGTMPHVTAREMMVRNLITLSPKMDALEALDVLLRQRISGAPVVDEDGHFAGVFSEKSCMKFVVGMAYENLPSIPVGRSRKRFLMRRVVDCRCWIATEN